MGFELDSSWIRAQARRWFLCGLTVALRALQWVSCAAEGRAVHSAESLGSGGDAPQGRVLGRG